jgi:hypothetical protein
MLPYQCILNERETFQGLSVSMPRERAFNELLKSDHRSAWFYFSTRFQKFFEAQVDSDPKEWAPFSTADTWMIRSSGFPCAGNRYLSLVFFHSRVKEILVFCQTLPKAGN